VAVQRAGWLNVRTWRVLAVLGAVVLYVLSISGSAYEFTTPVEMAHHVLLRKIYAVGAFALLGLLVEKSQFERMRGVLDAALAVALFSFAIEIGQISIDHVVETFGQHSFDVASGFVGGALGAFAVVLFRAPRERARRIEAFAIALSLGALGWGYLVTYALVDVVKPVLSGTLR
jgi:hypothetical protein